MNDPSVIDLVTTFATNAHGEQRRKYTPEPYIVHPIRVMKLCAEYTDKITILCAALLHDVLEDTEVDEKQMRDFLRSVMEDKKADETLRLVIDLTKVLKKKIFPR